MEEAFRQILGLARGSASISKLVEEISSGDDFREMQGLTQLCDIINSSSEGALTGINESNLVTAICACLRKDYNPELVLLAARSLTYLIDAAPNIVPTLSQESNLEAILSHLVSVEDIEVAQQCIDCVDKLCAHPVGAMSVFQNNGIALMFMFLDFFTISTQKKVWRCVWKCSRYVYTSTYEKVRETVPLFRTGLRNSDADISDYCCGILSTIIVRVSENPVLVRETFGDLLEYYITLLNDDQSFTTKSIKSKVDLLFVASSLDASVAKDILKGDLLPLLEKRINWYIDLMEVSLDSSSFTHFPIVGMCNIYYSLITPYTAQGFECFPSLYTLDVPGGARSKLFQINARKKGVDAQKSSTPAEVKSGDGASTEGDSSSQEDEEAYEEDDSDTDDEEDDELVFPSYNLNGVDLLKIRNKIKETGVTFENMQSCRQCNIGRHICDACGKKNLPLHDWFRCNERNDTDFCSSCLMKQAEKEDKKYLRYTDMYTLFLPEAKKIIISACDKEKWGIYKSDTALFTRLLTHSLKTLTRVCCTVEVLAARVSAFLFLLGVVHMASMESLEKAGFFDLPLGQMVTTNMYDRRLLSNNFLSVWFAKMLLEKCPAKVETMFQREGVASAAAKLQSNLQAAGTFPAEVDYKMQQNTPSGWRTTTLKEAESLCKQLKTSEYVQPKEIASCKKAFQEKDFDQAFRSLRTLLDTHLTSFEFSNSHLLDDLLNGFKTVSDMNILVQFIDALAAPSKDHSVSPLKTLVILLQRLISNEETFSPLVYGVKNIKSLVTVKLIPQKVPGVKAESEEGDTGNKTKHSVGKSAAVGIVPLAEIKTISTFIRDRLLPHSSILSRGETGEEVEEVLPTTAPRRASEARQKEQVYVRCGTYVLPESLTVLQVVDSPLLGAVMEGKKSDEPVDEINQMLEKMQEQKKEIVLHYSITRFDKNYEVFRPPRAPLLSRNAPDTPAEIVLPSDSPNHSQCRTILNSISAPLLSSKPFLTEDIEKALALISLLFNCVSHWPVLAKYYHAHTGNSVKLELNITKSDFIHAKLDEKALRHCSDYLIAGQHPLPVGSEPRHRLPVFILFPHPQVHV
ncbi:hypothetical protein ADEAN_000379100 [Angomonas deanei]|uniref:HECT-type E3 ubiquitin transferase n=1 Tax=Angomonas deanei TaxID=59799 RepID=A0A7G2C9V0_9TRYP|nr:hypothetical protein ADEAN_000379100 [Angomonas deanei]